MRSFRELREKLKTATRDSQSVREEMNSLQVAVKQLQDSERNLMVLNQQAREKAVHLNAVNEELKKKVGMLKSALAEKGGGGAPDGEEGEVYGEKDVTGQECCREVIKREDRVVVEISESCAGGRGEDQEGAIGDGAQVEVEDALPKD
ncbi:unnamed protein product [Sphagnum balticum]